MLHKHLKLALRLLESPHDAVTEPKVVAVGDHAGNYGVIRTLARFQSVEVVGVQGEERTTVVEAHVRARHDHACAEPLVDAVDEGAGVALAIHGRDVDGIAAQVELP